MRTVDQRQHFKSPPALSVISNLRVGWLRAVVFALIWWILVDGELSSWPVGVPVVIIATLVSIMLLPPTSGSLKGLIRFVPFFLWHSLRGGVDVLRRVMHPQLLISPKIYDYRWRLQTDLSRVLMVNVVSLLPGTLSVDLDDEYLRIHVLDQTGDFASELAVIEVRVAELFGLDLSIAGGKE